MPSPFQRLTVDGSVLDREQLLTWAERVMHEHSDAAWTASLFATLQALTSDDGTIAAHTSGTTGPPKPLRIPAEDLIASAQLTASVFQLNPGDRVLHALPCDFIAGKLMLVRAFVSGLDLHVVDPTGDVLDHAAHGRYRFTALVPQQLERTLSSDRARVERLLDVVLLGGGPVGAPLEDAVQGLRTQVFHGYGSTETVTHVALRALNGPDRSDLFTAIGPATFGMDERGCLLIHTPHLSVHEHITNDVVELLDERRFRWLGRHDNVILSGGLKFFPEELEARTLSVLARPHFFLAEPDERLGQRITLVLEGAELSGAEREEIGAALERVLTKHERPKRITTLRSFRRTSSGKVVRSLG